MPTDPANAPPASGGAARSTALGVPPAPTPAGSQASVSDLASDEAGSAIATSSPAPATGDPAPVDEAAGETGAPSATPSSAPFPPAASASAGASPAPPTLPWDALALDPGAFLGQRVRIVVQLHSLLESWNPYLSRFGPRDHRALRAWSDEQRLWYAGEHDSPALRLFVRRAGAADRVFEGAGTYERFEVDGTVREVFAGSPWIEVDSARRLTERVGEGVLIHATRATSLIASERWALARAELERALEGELPAPARADLERLLAECEAAQAEAREPR